MTALPNHSSAPLPWRIAGKGTVRGAGKDSWVCSLHWRHREGNGALIIEAVNGHEALKARIRELEAALATEKEESASYHKFWIEERAKAASLRSAGAA